MTLELNTGLILIDVLAWIQTSDGGGGGGGVETVYSTSGLFYSTEQTSWNQRCPRLRSGSECEFGLGSGYRYQQKDNLDSSTTTIIDAPSRETLEKKIVAFKSLIENPHLFNGKGMPNAGSNPSVG